MWKYETNKQNPSDHIHFFYSAFLFENICFLNKDVCTKTYFLTEDLKLKDKGSVPSGWLKLIQTQFLCHIRSCIASRMQNDCEKQTEGQ